MSELIRRYHASTTAPGEARRDVAAFLQGSEQENVQIVTLLVAELVTNSVLHAGGIVEVHTSQFDGIVRVEVSDTSDAMPIVRRPDIGGRGLRLVEQLAESWGIERLEGGGKTVWAEVAHRPPPSGVAD